MSSVPNAVTSGQHADSDLLIIDANRSSHWLDLAELWRYRNLIWIFAVRDVTVKYRQTLVGVAWTVLQPLASMLAFGVLKKVLVASRDDIQVPDEISTFCGLVLYQLFSGILGAATLCLVDNRQMVTKVYFPRAALPVSACLRPLLDFSIGSGVFVILLFCFRVVPSPWIVLAPIIVAMTVVVGLAIGLWLSALNALYRDIGYIVPFLLNLGLIVSPVAYEASKITGPWRLLYFANPMATLLEMFRWTILGTPMPGFAEALISLASAMVLLFSGAWYFHRVDRCLADSI